jgi:uncharacterized tellurite resistance protein B-like protein
MRPYPQNSPPAAARIVALAMFADGGVCRAEMAVLNKVRAHEALNMSQTALHTVVNTFCADLLALNNGHLDACHLDDRTLMQLMSEVDDPALQVKVMQLCVSVAEADGRVGNSEHLVLTAAVEHWGLHRKMFMTTGA